MNQSEMAEATGLSISMISRICSGQRVPSLEQMRNIEQVLAWPVDAQVAAQLADSYAAEFKSTMEIRSPRRRDANSQAVRGMRGAGTGDDRLHALETGTASR